MAGVFPVLAVPRVGLVVVVLHCRVTARISSPVVARLKVVSSEVVSWFGSPGGPGVEVLRFRCRFVEIAERFVVWFRVK